MKSARQAYLLSSHPNNGIVVSITIENVATLPTPGECRKSLEDKKTAYGSPSGLRFSRVTGKSAGAELPPSADVLEFLLDTGAFATVRQKQFFSCATHGNAFVDIHMSKAGFVPADQPGMERILQSLQFVTADASMVPSVESSTELMAPASRRFLMRDYAGAIPLYQRALKLEQAEQRLPPDLWRVLVDNLGMSLGITGKGDAAEEVFRYGIALDPNYAMFHYNLACARAEKNDMAGAMAELTIAFRNRGTMMKGEAMPDPAKDDSFANFMSNKEFLQFLKQIR